MTRKTVSVVTLLFFLVFSFSNTVSAYPTTHNEGQQREGILAENQQNEVLPEDQQDQQKKEVLEKDNAGNQLPLLTCHDEYETDRFIVKYKNNAREKTKIQHCELLQDKLTGVKKISGKKGRDYELVILTSKLKAKDFINALDLQTAEIDYIQPDYIIQSPEYRQDAPQFKSFRPTTSRTFYQTTLILKTSGD